MEKYIWIQKYSVGVESIDEQHQRFFELVSEVIKMTGQGSIPIGSLLLKVADLNNYATLHFQNEEDIFKKYNYPNAKEHVTSHDACRKRVEQFNLELKQENMNTKKIAAEMAEFLGSWLVNHVMTMDQKYVGFMRKNGVK
jgi:hemerythrin-like metal-binding protein